MQGGCFLHLRKKAPHIPVALFPIEVVAMLPPGNIVALYTHIHFPLTNAIEQMYPEIVHTD